MNLSIFLIGSLSKLGWCWLIMGLVFLLLQFLQIFAERYLPSGILITNKSLVGGNPGRYVLNSVCFLFLVFFHLVEIDVAFSRICKIFSNVIIIIIWIAFKILTEGLSFNLIFKVIFSYCVLNDFFSLFCRSLHFVTYQSNLGSQDTYVFTNKFLY